MLDLPVEEAGRVRAAAVRAAGIDTIFLLSPTTTDDRIRRAADARQRLPLRDLAPRRHRRARRRWPTRRAELVARVRAETTTCRWRSASASRARSTCASVGQLADAAVVGSALVNVIARARAASRICSTRRGAVRAMAEELSVEALRDARSTSIDEPHRPAARSARALRRTRSAASKHESGLADLRARRARPRCSRTCSAVNAEPGGPLDGEAVERLFERIIDEARRIERLEADGRHEARNGVRRRLQSGE